MRDPKLTHWEDISQAIHRAYFENPLEFMDSPVIRRHLGNGNCPGSFQQAKAMQEFHLSRMACNGIELSALSQIVEFGGGFGGLCQLIRAAGFGGSYQIVDLPPMREVQRDYLGRVGIDAIWPEDLPRFGDLFIATFSLSEVESGAREDVEAVLDGYAAVYFAYCRSWQGSDEYSYFAGLQARHPRFLWTQEKHPTGGGKRFLTGIRQ